jgi:hypothetical protein
MVCPTFFREIRFSSNATNKALKELVLEFQIDIPVAIQKQTLVYINFFSQDEKDCLLETACIISAMESTSEIIKC